MCLFCNLYGDFDPHNAQCHVIVTENLKKLGPPRRLRKPQEFVVTRLHDCLIMYDHWPSLSLHGCHFILSLQITLFKFLVASTLLPGYHFVITIFPNVFCSTALQETVYVHSKYWVNFLFLYLQETWKVSKIVL